MTREPVPVYQVASPWARRLARIILLSAVALVALVALFGAH